jgi:SAM-dependent methyltransferase
MPTAPPTDTARPDVARLDPYAFLALLGKRVIHPGGRRATEEVIGFTDFAPGQRVLDIGCGVATTAIEVARRFGITVTAAEISPLMLARRGNVTRAGLSDRVAVEQADILNLPYPEGNFDRVVAEAVTMFVDRPRAAAELDRVCTPGGWVLATEFCWRRPPTPRAREVFLGQVCPGLQFDTVDEWTALYEKAGLIGVRVATGPFDMMTPRGFLADEGAHALRVAAAALTPARLCKMAWLMPWMMRAVPYLGYVVIAGTKSAT